MMKTAPLLEPDPGVKELRTVDPSQETGLALVIERLAANPSVDVAKLEKIIELQERILRQQAEQAFNAAFATMQAVIPTIIERAQTDKASYAPLEDIMEPLRPVLCQYGFSVSHKTEWPDPKTVRVIGILTHRDGHARTSEFVSGADQTGSKNGIQALGSAVAYGRRYTTKDLLNIVTRGEDDDAERVGRPDVIAPAGFEKWYDDLTAVADNGTKALEAMWGATDQKSIAFKNHLVKTNRKAWENLKVRAAKAKAS